MARPTPKRFFRGGVQETAPEAGAAGARRRKAELAELEARIGYEQNVAENKAVLANIKTKKIEFLYDVKTGTFSVK